MSLRFSGADVRVALDGRVWVLMPAGVVGPAARWQAVSIDEISFDADFPYDLITRYARHPLGDLGVNAFEMARVLGRPRRDARRAAELWRAEGVVRGDALAVDFAARELTTRAAEMVWPFSAIAGVAGDDLLEKTRPGAAPRRLAIGTFPMSSVGLARELAP